MAKEGQSFRGVDSGDVTTDETDTKEQQMTASLSSAQGYRDRSASESSEDSSSGNSVSSYDSGSSDSSRSRSSRRSQQIAKEKQMYSSRAYSTKSLSRDPSMKNSPGSERQTQQMAMPPIEPASSLKALQSPSDSNLRSVKQVSRGLSTRSTVPGVTQISAPPSANFTTEPSSSSTGDQVVVAPRNPSISPSDAATQRAIASSAVLDSPVEKKQRQTLMHPKSPSVSPAEDKTLRDMLQAKTDNMPRATVPGVTPVSPQDRGQLPGVTQVFGSPSATFQSKQLNALGQVVPAPRTSPVSPNNGSTQGVNSSNDPVLHRQANSTTGNLHVQTLKEPRIPSVSPAVDNTLRDILLAKADNTPRATVPGVTPVSSQQNGRVPGVTQVSGSPSAGFNSKQPRVSERDQVVVTPRIPSVSPTDASVQRAILANDPNLTRQMDSTTETEQGQALIEPRIPSVSPAADSTIQDILQMKTQRTDRTTVPGAAPVSAQQHDRNTTTMTSRFANKAALYSQHTTRSNPAQSDNPPVVSVSRPQTTPNNQPVTFQRDLSTEMTGVDVAEEKARLFEAMGATSPSTASPSATTQTPIDSFLVSPQTPPSGENQSQGDTHNQSDFQRPSIPPPTLTTAIAPAIAPRPPFGSPPPIVTTQPPFSPSQATTGITPALREKMRRSEINMLDAQQQQWLQQHHDMSAGNLSRQSYDDEMPKPGVAALCMTCCQRNRKIIVLSAVFSTVVLALLLTLILVLARGTTEEPQPQQGGSEQRVSFLREKFIPLSGKEALDTVGSPQNSALDWLANRDPARTALDDSHRLLQRYVLAVLYYSTGGDRWANSFFFLSGDDECRWNRWNTEKEYLNGVTCDGDRIIFIHLGRNSLNGNIPPELQELKHLSRISLESNLLKGTIPPQLTNISTLEALQLNFNTLSGSIPDQIGQLTALETLDLSANILKGRMPDSMASLTRMVDVRLFSNRLSGPVPLYMKNWTKLEVIWLYDNSLRGDIEFLCDANVTEIAVDCVEVRCTCDSCDCF